MQLEEQMRALKPIKAEVLLLSSEKMRVGSFAKRAICEGPVIVQGAGADPIREQADTCYKRRVA